MLNYNLIIMIKKILLIIKTILNKILNFRKLSKDKKDKEKTDDIYPLF